MNLLGAKSPDPGARPEAFGGVMAFMTAGEAAGMPTFELGLALLVAVDEVHVVLHFETSLIAESHLFVSTLGQCYFGLDHALRYFSIGRTTDLGLVAAVFQDSLESDRTRSARFPAFS